MNGAHRYPVVEVFPTIQGEGYWAGTPSVFVRFGGCNLWSGHDEDRDGDTARTGARCPSWCDTDFVPRELNTLDVLIARIVAATRGAIRHVVLTGGEPLLSVDASFLGALRGAHPTVRVAVETNGTREPRDGCVFDWVTLSPKVSADRLKLCSASELKVVVPDYEPSDYDAVDAEHRFVQPRALVLPGVGRSRLCDVNAAYAIDFVMQNPQWRLSTQTHKVHGIP